MQTVEMLRHDVAVADSLHRALAEPSRARLVEELAAAGRPLSADELALRLDLHPNTVRAHLDVLEAAGLVHGEIEHRRRRGRPHRVYVAVEGADGDGAVGRILVDGLAALPDGGALAERAGRERGLRLAEGAARTPDGERLEAVVGMLARTGFTPRAVVGSPDRVEMWSCPMRELADAHPAIVCGLHRGVIEGFLEGLGSADARVRLEVRPAPGPCVALVEAGGDR